MDSANSSLAMPRLTVLYVRSMRIYGMVLNRFYLLMLPKDVNRTLWCKKFSANIRSAAAARTENYEPQTREIIKMTGRHDYHVHHQQQHQESLAELNRSLIPKWPSNNKRSEMPVQLHSLQQIRWWNCAPGRDAFLPCTIRAALAAS